MPLIPHRAAVKIPAELATFPQCSATAAIPRGPGHSCESTTGSGAIAACLHERTRTLVLSAGRGPALLAQGPQERLGSRRWYHIRFEQHVSGRDRRAVAICVRIVVRSQHTA